MPLKNAFDVVVLVTFNKLRPNLLCQVVRMSRKHIVGSVHRCGQQNCTSAFYTQPSIGLQASSTGLLFGGCTRPEAWLVVQ